MTEFSAADHAYMARALRLAEKGLFTTQPNPRVGCVIAHGEKNVGEGFHLRAGEPHAEVLALRATGDKWMDWQAGELNNSWRYAFPALARNSPQHTDQALIDAGVSEWNRHMQMLEEQLQRSGDYVLGDNFSLADIPVGLSVNRWSMTPMSRPALPAVSAYYDRLNQREGYRLFGRNGMV